VQRNAQEILEDDQKRSALAPVAEWRMGFEAQEEAGVRQSGNLNKSHPSQVPSIPEPVIERAIADYQTKKSSFRRIVGLGFDVLVPVSCK
jgi:hypothetical protein